MSFMTNMKTFAAAAALAAAGLMQPAAAQDKENLWADVQERGTLRVGVAEAPPLLVPSCWLALVLMARLLPQQRKAHSSIRS